MSCKRLQLGCERRFNIEFCSDSHFRHSAYVTWSRVELWSAHVSARLSDFCCRTHFVRRDVRVERSSDVTSCLQKWRKCLLKKVRQRTFLYDTKSPDYREQHMRAPPNPPASKPTLINSKLGSVTGVWKSTQVTFTNRRTDCPVVTINGTQLTVTK
jgi:hypothetical protein